ncbi:MAG: conserved phage C-terminal domain-containing protein [Syntrophales bacterium]|nr:conserved phage C-terminal domain-containing protein [Syntrophales bacterium]
MPICPHSNAECEHYPCNNIPYDEIITDLNTATGKHYRNIKSTRDLINARWKEGYMLDSFKAVHRNMAAAWRGDAEFDQYLRPATLYQARKFEGYLNRAQAHADPVASKGKDDLLSALKNENNRTMPPLSDAAKKVFFSLGVHWTTLQQRVLSGENIFLPPVSSDHKMAAAGER